HPRGLRPARGLSGGRGAEATGAPRGHRASDPRPESHRRARARDRGRIACDVPAAGRGRLLRRAVVGSILGGRRADRAPGAAGARRDAVQRSRRALLLDPALGLRAKSMDWTPYLSDSPERLAAWEFRLWVAAAILGALAIVLVFVAKDIASHRSALVQRRPDDQATALNDRTLEPDEEATTPERMARTTEPKGQAAEIRPA